MQKFLYTILISCLTSIAFAQSSGNDIVIEQNTALEQSANFSNEKEDNASVIGIPVPRDRSEDKKTSFHSSEISIFPNPASDYISIEGISNETEIKIVDATGKTVLREQTPNHKISINHLPRGMYYVILTNEEQSSVNKLTVYK